MDIQAIDQGQSWMRPFLIHRTWLHRPTVDYLLLLALPSKLYSVQASSNLQPAKICSLVHGSSIIRTGDELALGNSDCLEPETITDGLGGMVRMGRSVHRVKLRD